MDHYDSVISRFLHVDFDPVGTALDGPFNRRERIFRGSGRSAAVRHDLGPGLQRQAHQPDVCNQQGDGKRGRERPDQETATGQARLAAEGRAADRRSPFEWQAPVLVKLQDQQTEAGREEKGDCEIQHEADQGGQPQGEEQSLHRVRGERYQVVTREPHQS